MGGQISRQERERGGETHRQKVGVAIEQFCPEKNPKEKGWRRRGKVVHRFAKESHIEKKRRLGDPGKD